MKPCRLLEGGGREPIHIADRLDASAGGPENRHGRLTIGTFVFGRIIQLQRRLDVEFLMPRNHEFPDQCGKAESLLMGHFLKFFVQSGRCPEPNNNVLVSRVAALFQCF
jgi:hypothetical protein